MDGSVAERQRALSTSFRIEGEQQRPPFVSRKGEAEGRSRHMNAALLDGKRCSRTAALLGADAMAETIFTCAGSNQLDVVAPLEFTSL